MNVVKRTVYWTDFEAVTNEYLTLVSAVGTNLVELLDIDQIWDSLASSYCGDTYSKWAQAT